MIVPVPVIVPVIVIMTTVVAVRVVNCRMVVADYRLPGVLVPGVSSHDSTSLRWCGPTATLPDTIYICEPAKV